MSRAQKFGLMVFVWDATCAALAALAIFRPHDTRPWMGLSLLAYGLMVGSYGVVASEAPPEAEGIQMTAWSVWVVCTSACWVCLLFWWLMPRTQELSQLEVQGACSRIIVALLAVAAGGALHIERRK